MDAAAEILTQARLRSQLTRSELSRRTSTTRAALLEYEKGIRTPRFDTMLKLLDATGTELVITLPPDPSQTDKAGRLSTLADVASNLVDDSAANWRLLISDFVANEFVPATSAERSRMLSKTPASLVRTDWKQFVRALGEHLAFHAEIPAPAWALALDDPLPAFWWPVHGELASQRAAAMAWSPASFRRRHILVDGRELPVVTR